MLEDLNNRPKAYDQGYRDGMSCCENWGQKTARQLAKRKRPPDRYGDGKKQAAIDWLKKHNIQI